MAVGVDHTMADPIELKPGLKTSELLLAVLLLVIGAVLTAYGAKISNDVLTGIGATVSTLAVGMFTVSRTRVKEAAITGTTPPEAPQ